MEHLVSVLPSKALQHDSVPDISGHVTDLIEGTLTKDISSGARTTVPDTRCDALERKMESVLERLEALEIEIKQSQFSKRWHRLEALSQGTSDVSNLVANVEQQLEGLTLEGSFVESGLTENMNDHDRAPVQSVINSERRL